MENENEYVKTIEKYEVSDNAKLDLIRLTLPMTFITDLYDDKEDLLTTLS
jgi:hypothetical protein